ncbi:MAG: M48 family metalloprotease [Desulfuromonadales bacterium]|nr:M48 family metalloprotease [Desulfuromonadales bacterium]
MFRHLVWMLVLVVLVGCAVNPVTGRKELTLIGEGTELQIGAEQYAPLRQMQGGDYSTQPQITAYVKEIGGRLAAVSDRPLPYEFQVINDSTPNAWALPGGKIAINRGLLTEMQSEAELAAVLGHEIIHAAARHSAQSMQRGMLLQGAVVAAAMAAGNSEYAGLAIGGASLAAGLVSQQYSREAEREADYYGMLYMSRAGYDPSAAVDLQQTFVRLSEGRQSNWLEGLFASHPPSQERVDANRRTVSELPAGGEMGVERYRRVLAPLISAQKAYDAHDEGRKALNDNRADRALTLADQAIAGEPKEALFYGLRGDALRKQGREREAVAAFDQALQRQPDYFHYYLQRGLAYQALGEIRSANADLERSVALLPTAPAMNSLGQLALNQGNRARALEYFTSAASSDSAAGRQAHASLVRLDLSTNPEKYLKLDLALDRQGQLIARLVNQTPVAVGDITLEVGYNDQAGKRRQTRLRIAGPVAAGTTYQVVTGLGPISDPAGIKNLGSRILAAQVAE